VDQRGFRTTYGYDSLDRQTQVQDPAGGLATTVYDLSSNVLARVDQRGDRTTFAYDALNRDTQVQDAAGGLVTTIYDAADNVTATVDQRGDRTTYSFDAANRQTQVQDAGGGLATTQYDKANNVTLAIDQVGNRTTYAYDVLDRRTTLQDPLGYLTTTAYDKASNVTAVTNARGYTTTYAYDVLNRQTQVQDAAGNLTTTQYDKTGNVTDTIDARGSITTYAYDVLNRQMARTDPLNHTTTTAYDLASNATAVTDPAGFTTSYSFDGLNRQTQVQAADQGISTRVYDLAGNVVNTVDQLGYKTTYGYDVLNRQTLVTDPRAGITTTVYDATSNRVNLIDASGNKTTFAYDALNRLTKQTDPLGNSATFAYDLDSRMTSATDRDGRRRDFRFDGDSRKTGETWTVSASTANLFTFTYDGNGNMLTAANYAGAYTMSYDALDRVTATQEPFGQALTSSYDPVGNRTQVQDSQGGLATSVYDAANRLTSRKSTGQAPLRIDLTYTARDQIATETRYSNINGTTTVASTTFSYDAVGRETHRQHLNASNANLANYTYTYDLAGEVKKQILNGTTTTYNYDASHQLTYDTSSTSNTYSYDATGNRAMTGYSTGKGNQLLNDGTWTYTYDAEGNEIKKSQGSSKNTWNFTYDNQNRLLTAKDANTDGGAATLMATYVYDALGDRVEKDVCQGGVTTVTRFAYDLGSVSRPQSGLAGGDIWADLNGSNALQTRYLRGDQVDQLFASVSSSGTVSWQLTDRLGSVRNVVNNSGVLQDTITYDGYGCIKTETNAASGGRYKFTGREQDTETGLQFSRNRYYDPKIGRWIEQDPLGFDAGDTNLYRYVHNEPSNAGDPSGLFEGLYATYIPTKTLPITKLFGGQLTGHIVVARTANLLDKDNTLLSTTGTFLSYQGTNPDDVTWSAFYRITIRWHFLDVWDRRPIHGYYHKDDCLTVTGKREDFPISNSPADAPTYYSFFFHWTDPTQRHTTDESWLYLDPRSIATEMADLAAKKGPIEGEGTIKLISAVVHVQAYAKYFTGAPGEKPRAFAKVTFHYGARYYARFREIHPMRFEDPQIDTVEELGPADWDAVEKMDRFLPKAHRQGP
jgi:RHS repeat-associated protein